MDFSQIASSMYPYWILGLVMAVLTVLSGNKDLLRVEKKPVIKWFSILAIVFIFRSIVYRYYHPVNMNKESISAIASIPWQATLFVYWEDLAHGLPIVLLNRLIKSKWISVPVTALTLLIIMVAFGSGHVYQGNWPAIFLSLYIPFSCIIGSKYGFGTVMLCHTAYDLSTILFVKHMLGA